MMKLGELACFDEEQRIAIFEMVKSGSISIEAAHAEVKRANPASFLCKYAGTTPMLATTLKNTLTDAKGAEIVNNAYAKYKKSKSEAAAKVNATISTVGLRTASDMDTIENDPIGSIVYAGVVAADKKRVAVVVGDSKVGVNFVRYYVFDKSKDADAFSAAIAERRKASKEERSVVCMYVHALNQPSDNTLHSLPRRRPTRQQTMATRAPACRWACSRCSSSDRCQWLKWWGMMLLRML